MKQKIIRQEVNKGVDEMTSYSINKNSNEKENTEIVYCGEYGANYRRVTWSRNGKKRIVWRWQINSVIAFLLYIALVSYP